MLRRAGVRRFVRWCGIAVVVMLPVLWVVSVYWHVDYVCVRDEWSVY